MTTVADALRAAGYTISEGHGEDVTGKAREEAVAVAVYPRHIAPGVVKGYWLLVEVDGHHHNAVECRDADEVYRRAHDALKAYGRAA